MSAADDTTAISNLIAKYAELVDDGDFAGVGALFASGVFKGGGASVTGSADIEKMLRGMVIRYEDGTPRTHHVTTNTAIEFDAGDATAVARSYFTVFQALPGLPLQAVVAGRYRDRFERVEGQWRFAEREVQIRLTGELSGHLRASAGE
ncbi:nuclear transport factor 2 family protein [Nocardia inohanensis]|uniref:nuclear transport factor 2 family protein n=1 Tax=Nocardia inohanensis TaxID=209246 RepID=UPI000834F77D|nr:nuclear transport factor 2 family protein [Nocardia inohanensis]